MSKRLYFAEINDLADREDAFHLPYRLLQANEPRPRFHEARGERHDAARPRPARHRAPRPPHAD